MTDQPSRAPFYFTVSREQLLTVVEVPKDARKNSRWKNWNKALHTLVTTVPGMLHANRRVVGQNTPEFDFGFDSEEAANKFGLRFR
jgi:antibiotic biosynthesis monooxygenase (ABM) superfamily enzyme